jgi:hypothetical protein
MTVRNGDVREDVLRNARQEIRGLASEGKSVKGREPGRSRPPASLRDRGGVRAPHPPLRVDQRGARLFAPGVARRSPAS